ncbi:hypothetical protein [Chlorobaculum limnaeum]|uniref:hypothetical protein n=1 Tax=Chlorobaculum limnaeum TaxID=274537 RepID=UPI0014725E1F|nr:hypothetical protein [Chlorobaculum limnaeum]
MKDSFRGVAQCGQKAKGFIPEISGIGFNSIRRHNAAGRFHAKKNGGSAQIISENAHSRPGAMKNPGNFLLANMSSPCRETE